MLSWSWRTFSGKAIGRWIQLPCPLAPPKNAPNPLGIDQQFPLQSLLLQVMITVGSIYWTLETEEVLTATDGNKVWDGLQHIFVQFFKTNDLQWDALEGAANGQMVSEEQDAAGRFDSLILRLWSLLPLILESPVRYWELWFTRWKKTKVP